MSKTTEDVKKQLEQTVEMLQTLRDEMRLKAHLASMDAKKQWNELEPYLLDAQDRARKVAHKLEEIGDILTAP